MSFRHAAAFALALGLASTPAAAQEGTAPAPAPALLSADQIVHDQELGIVTASGNVEISQNDRVLLADAVSYNLRQDVISASGNVALLEPTGEVIFAEYFELTGDLKNGTARDMRMLLADRSRMAAVLGRRIDGTRSELTRAVYSPCEPCEEDPEAALVWQLKAERVTHDQIEKTVRYRNARLEMFGLPVLYTPFFSHPDPTVTRQSGFLFPSFGQGTSLGASTTVPYFWAISDQEDVTFSPMVTSTEGVVLAGEHRRRNRLGETLTVASVTQNSKGDVRGHIDATGIFHLSPVWRAGYQVERSTDDTYLRRYGFGEPRPWLTTRPYLEGFSNRSYALVEGYSFQGLRETDDPGQSPLILPLMRYSFVGQPGRAGGYWTFDGNAMAVTRGEGRDTRRLSLNAGWRLPYAAPAGDIYTLTASLRGDVYHTNDFDTSGSSSQGRAVPQLALEWRYPLVRPGDQVQQVVEPVVLAVASPYGMNSPDIPNEDSVEVDFDEINLFSPSRFSGLDRIETGPRVSYGLRWGAYHHLGGYLSGIVGQSYRLRPQADFRPGSGLDAKFSDYVGRFTLRPQGNLAMHYRFRLDKDDWSARRQELSLAVGPEALRASTSYVFYDRPSPDSEFPAREALSLTLSSAITRNWSGSMSSSHDLAEDGGPRALSLVAQYEDECFTFLARAERNYTFDRDVPAGHSIVFQLIFRNLGEIALDTF